jgi:hypothetical protein
VFTNLALNVSSRKQCCDRNSVTSSTCSEDVWGNGGMAPRILYLALDGGEWLASYQAALPLNQTRPACHSWVSLFQFTFYLLTCSLALRSSKNFGLLHDRYAFCLHFASTSSFSALVNHSLRLPVISIFFSTFSLSWARWIQSRTTKPIYLRSILIVTSLVVVSFFHFILQKFCIHFASLQCVLHVWPVSSFLISVS